MLHTPIAQVTTIMTACVVLWAFRRGRWPERFGAVVIALDCAGTILFQDRRPHHHVQPAWFVLDSVQAIAFLAIAALSRRTWTLWAAAFAVLLALTHVTFLLNSAFGQWSYLTVVYIWGVGLLGALAVGTMLEGSAADHSLPWMHSTTAATAARPSIPSARARRRS